MGLFKKKEKKKKFVILEHLQGIHKGHKFWSMNSEDNTKTSSGKVIYKEIGFTDDADEAIKMCLLISELKQL